MMSFVFLRVKLKMMILRCFTFSQKEKITMPPCIELTHIASTSIIYFLIFGKVSGFLFDSYLSQKKRVPKVH